MFVIMTTHPIGRRTFTTRALALCWAQAFGLPARLVHEVSTEGEVSARVPAAR